MEALLSRRGREDGFASPGSQHRSLSAQFQWIQQRAMADQAQQQAGPCQQQGAGQAQPVFDESDPKAIRNSKLTLDALTATFKETAKSKSFLKMKRVEKHIRSAVKGAILSDEDQESLKELILTEGCDSIYSTSIDMEGALKMWISIQKNDAADTCRSDMLRFHNLRYPRVQLRIDEVARYLEDLNDTKDCMTSLEYTDSEIREFLNRCMGQLTVHIEILNLHPRLSALWMDLYPDIDMETCPLETKVPRLKCLTPRITNGPDNHCDGQPQQPISSVADKPGQASTLGNRERKKKQNVDLKGRDTAWDDMERAAKGLTKDPYGHCTIHPNGKHSHLQCYTTRRKADKVIPGIGEWLETLTPTRTGGHATGNPTCARCDGTSLCLSVINKCKGTSITRSCT